MSTKAGELHRRRIDLALIAATLLLTLGLVLTNRPVFFFAVGVVVTVVTVKAARLVRGMDKPSRSSVMPWLLASVVFLVCFGGWILVNTAGNYADATQRGRSGAPALVGIRLTSWGGEAATLAWTTDKVDRSLRPLARSCVMYLGESRGTLFVYMPDDLHPATFRVPAALAVVRVVPDGDCVPGERRPV